MWKLLTAIFVDKIYDHLLMNNNVPYEQKEYRKAARGTKDQLLIDKVMLKEVKRFRKNVTMAYINYRKAYNVVPHSLILEMMEVTGAAKNVGSLIRRSMSNWCTVLNPDGKKPRKCQDSQRDLPRWLITTTVFCSCDDSIDYLTGKGEVWV